MYVDTHYNNYALKISVPAKRMVLKTPEKHGTTHYVSMNPALSSTRLTEFTLCASVYTTPGQLTSTTNGHWLLTYGVINPQSKFVDKLGLGVGVGFVAYKIVGSDILKQTVTFFGKRVI